MKKLLLVLQRAALCRKRKSSRRNSPECPQALRVRGYVIITSNRGLDGKRREGRVILTNAEFKDLLRVGPTLLSRHRRK